MLQCLFYLLPLIGVDKELRNVRTNLLFHLISGLVLFLFGCTTPKLPVSEPFNTNHKSQAVSQNYVFKMPNYNNEWEISALADNFQRYQQLLSSNNRNTDELIAYLRDPESPEALKNNLRVQWLNSLGKNKDWDTFNQQYQLLPLESRNQNIDCYHDLMVISTIKTISQQAQQLARSTDNLPDACNQLIKAAVYSGSVSSEDAWRRVWVLMSYNKLSEAQELASILGEPINLKNNKQEVVNINEEYHNAAVANLMSQIVTPYARNKTNADARLSDAIFSGRLDNSQASFAHGILGMSKAKDLNMPEALRHFQAADESLLTEEQWQWYARAALRLQQWAILDGIIGRMPQKLQENPAWQYWRARAADAQGMNDRARELYYSASQSGRNFYAILATEALGGKLNAQNNIEADGMRISKILQDKNIQQALVLFFLSLEDGNRSMRQASNLQWRYAVKDFDEEDLIAASRLAFDRQFYEMAIYSADKTDNLLNFDLRYPTPFKQIMNYYARENGTDANWAYGIIRQESRFMLGARSRSGASGLMQIMPDTARLIAKQIGISDYNINDMETNVQMGTWYLSDLEQKLGHIVLATAGYNAGPGRARKWQTAVPLEGAIYAETIPFDETRDYVKKVMANTSYYQANSGSQVNLTQRLGTIPAGR